MTKFEFRSNGHPTLGIELEMGIVNGETMELSKTEDIAAMESLIDWLPRHLPEDDDVAIAHGDFRLETLIVARNIERTVARVGLHAQIGHEEGPAVLAAIELIVGAELDIPEP